MIGYLIGNNLIMMLFIVGAIISVSLNTKKLHWILFSVGFGVQVISLIGKLRNPFGSSMAGSSIVVSLIIAAIGFAVVIAIESSKRRKAIMEMARQKEEEHLMEKQDNISE